MGNLGTQCVANLRPASLPTSLSGPIRSMRVFAILSVSPGIAFCFRTTLTASGILSFHIASSPARSTDTFGLIPCLPACQARLLRVGGIADAFGFFRVSSVGSAPGRGIFPFSRESRAASHLTSVARWLDVQPYPLLGTWRALALCHRLWRRRECATGTHRCRKDHAAQRFTRHPVNPAGKEPEPLANCRAARVLTKLFD